MQKTNKYFSHNSSRLKWLFLLLWTPLFACEGLQYTYREGLHRLEIDPEYFEVRPAIASDKTGEVASVLSIAQEHNAVAAVNGGFFSTEGYPCGALKIKQWIALPYRYRGAVGWSQDLSPSFARFWAEIPGIDGLNQERGVGKAILYTPIFGERTNSTAQGEDVVIRCGRVIDIQTNNALIPAFGCVLSLQEEHPLYGTFCVGDPWSYSVRLQPADWEQYDYIVAGAPLLLSEGYKVCDFSCERIIPSFLELPHPRTAVGLLPNGHWLFVVTEGMTISELQDYFWRQGCIAALNLDGGSSSTLVLDGEIKIEQETRAVSDAVLVVPKKS
ncbi:MAG: phosphodiester glycosidase family protein [Chlamydiales bacterium]